MVESAPGEVISVALPDGSRRELPQGVTISEVAFGIGPRLGRDSLGGRIDGEDAIVDLRTPLTGDCSLSLVTVKDPDSLEVIRHTAAHILADAILSLWPDAKLAIGPAIAEGFYYDIDLKHRIVPEDFEALEKKMSEIIAADTPIEREVVDREELLAKAKAEGDLYKAELIENLPEGEIVTVFRHGEGRFEDLCRGPHTPSTGYIKAFKLMKVAGSYWRGDETRPMLQRIYGTAWASKKELKAYLFRLEEAQKRDHRRLGKDLDLFSFEAVAPASPFFLPKGTIIYNLLADYMRGLYRRYDYQEVITPQIFDVSLWKKSGHYDHYKDNMFFTTVDETEMAVKPMNCPSHTFIFSHRKRSYRELPMRIADFGRLHRYERSGATSGLTRVRSFCQDDAHIFCTVDQIADEARSVMSLVLEVYKTFGFDDIRVMLSTRPEKSVGSDEMWEKAESALQGVLESSELEFQLNPGDGAFYGPKIDFEVLDALKRPWQLATVQLDFTMPERFDLRYTASSGQDERPVMIHRAVLGSLERFIGILIEHTAGNLPFWLSPEQVRVISITDAQAEYGRKVVDQLKDAGVRASSDFGGDKVGAKIRLARLQRIPYILVVGDREMTDETVAVRERPDKNRGVKTVAEVLEMFKELERNHQ